MTRVITTAFFTRCWKRDREAAHRPPAGGLAEWPRRLERLACLLWVGLLLALLPPGLRAQVPGAEINRFNLERTEEGVLLSATLRLTLSPVVEDALKKGIPMHFVADAVTYRDRWYWTDREVASAARHMRLSYQALTRRWRLTVSPSPIGNAAVALGQTFDSSEEALAVIRRISQWKIAEPQDLDPDGRYSVHFRFRLDVSQLPRPFQIGAVGQSEWNLSVARVQRLQAEGGR